MEYQALYRKWRPARFDEVCGQEHITSTLKNQIILDRVGHAYLFTGTRGTGKTTCAKIFAKALNCRQQADGEPCGVCECCRLVESDSLYDILEIDAASKSRVEDIRGIIEEVVYAPSIGKTKVYIIDEVHMMTGNAFNALLKTLEEPPAYVVFILATTEAQKVPATILSRCQRFDFKRLSAATIADRLMHVARNEGIGLEADAAKFIGVLADGSLRDGLSIFEQCCTDGAVNKDDIVRIIGLAPLSDLIGIMTAAKAGDCRSALGIVDRLYRDSKRMDTLLSELVECYRDILMITSGGADIVYRSDEDIAALADVAKDFDSDYAVWCIETLSQAQNSMTRNSSNRIVAEICVVKLCRARHPDGDGDDLPPKKRFGENPSGPSFLKAKMADLKNADETWEHKEKENSKENSTADDKKSDKASATAQNAAISGAPTQEDRGKGSKTHGGQDGGKPAAPQVPSPMGDKRKQKMPCATAPRGAQTGGAKAGEGAVKDIYPKLKRELAVPGLLSFLPSSPGGYTLEGDVLTIHVDSQFFCEFLNKHDNYEKIAMCCKGILGGDTILKVVYDISADNNDLQEDLI